MFDTLHHVASSRAETRRKKALPELCRTQRRTPSPLRLNCLYALLSSCCRRFYQIIPY
ncbi:hypothetical protein YC2023_100055 [Brassica napus]